MIDVKRIFPECSADTLLVEKILQRGKPPHNKGITKVAKALENYSKGDVVIAVIDTDKFKRTPPYFERFTTIEDRLKEDGLRLDQLVGTNKYVIRIHPEFEQWIWGIAQKYEVDSTEYGYDTIKQLYAASKHEERNMLTNLKKFINAIVIKNPPPIQILREWLTKIDN